MSKPKILLYLGIVSGVMILGTFDSDSTVLPKTPHLQTPLSSAAPITSHTATPMHASEQFIQRITAKWPEVRNMMSYLKEHPDIQVDLEEDEFKMRTNQLIAQGHLNKKLSCLFESIKQRLSDPIRAMKGNISIEVTYSNGSTQLVQITPEELQVLDDLQVQYKEIQEHPYSPAQAASKLLNKQYQGIAKAFEAITEIEFLRNAIPYLHGLMELFREGAFTEIWYEQPNQIERAFPFLREYSQIHLTNFERELTTAVKTMISTALASRKIDFNIFMNKMSIYIHCCPGPLDKMYKTIQECITSEVVKQWLQLGIKEKGEE